MNVERQLQKLTSQMIDLLMARPDLSGYSDNAEGQRALERFIEDLEDMNMHVGMELEREERA